MKGDFTRSTFKPEKHYSSVRMQQGRVQLDADWNEQMDINSYRIEKETSDIISQCGVPEKGGGFKIESDEINLESNTAISYLTISEGSIYVEGILCENLNKIKITEQDDLPNYTLPTDDGIYVAYLDVWQRHITAIEDPQIREVALGGPDTATRTKNVWQVRLEKLENQKKLVRDGKINCDAVTSLWNKIIKGSNGELAAFTKQETPTNYPCDISASAGYRRLENQLYRVEIHNGEDIKNSGDINNVPAHVTFKWSRDNGSVVFAIDEFITDSNNSPTNEVKVKQLGKDKTLSVGNWVEVLDDVMELNGKSGELVHITDISEQTIKLSTAVPISDMKYHPRIRLWDMINGAISIVPPQGFDSIELDEDGIYVRFSGTSFKAGDYWLIPARTATENTQETGKIEWPLDENEQPKAMPSDGIKHHYCFLALVQRTSVGKNIEWEISDCRKRFPSLTEMTNLFHICGNGQEAMPSEELPVPLQVGVSNGKWPVEGALVQFEIIKGDGRLDAADPVSTDPLIVKTNGEGVAECKWILGIMDQHNPSIPPPQLVEARLLDACHKKVSTPPIRFNANLSVAGRVAYSIPDCTTSYDTCNVVGTSYKYWSAEQYPVIELFGEKNVPLLTNKDPIWKSHVNKFAKLILDSNDEHTLRTNDSIDIGSGFVLSAKNIDFKAKKVRLEFTKDGESIGEEFNLRSGPVTWAYKRDEVAGENDVNVFMINITNVFQQIGKVHISFTLDSDVKYTLRIGGSIDIGGGLAMAAKQIDVEGDKVWLEITKDGKFVEDEVVDLSSGPVTWKADKVDVKVNVTDVFQGQVDSLVVLTLDSDTKYSLRIGDPINIGGSLTLAAKQIDIEGDKVWLEITKNGELVEDEIVDLTSIPTTWNPDNVDVKVNVTDVFPGQMESFVKVSGLWLIDYTDPTTLELDDKIGDFVLAEIVNGVDESNLGGLIFKSTASPDDVSSTVKDLFKEISSWPPINNEGNISLKDVFDTFLCNFNAAHLPLKKIDLCRALNNESVKSVQDALNVLCGGTGKDVWRNGCCVFVSNVKELETAVDKLKDGDTICLLAGEYPVKTLDIEEKKDIVIRGCNLASKFIGNIKITNCQNVVIENLDISGDVGVRGENYRSEYIVLKNLNISGNVLAHTVNNFSLTASEILLVKDQTVKMINCSGVTIESNIFVNEVENGLVFEGLSDLKIRKNSISINLLSRATTGSFLGIHIIESADVDITDNLIRTLIERRSPSDEKIKEINAMITGIQLGQKKEVEGYVSVVNNKINAVNGPSLMIQSNGPVRVHRNDFKSIFQVLSKTNQENSTNSIINIVSARNHIIFTDNHCDSHSHAFSEKGEINLICLQSLDSIFSNNRCTFISVEEPDKEKVFLNHVHLDILPKSDFVANVIGNRCSESTQKETGLVPMKGDNIYSIYANQSNDENVSAILLGNITTNQISPKPRDLNLQQ